MVDDRGFRPQCQSLRAYRISSQSSRCSIELKMFLRYTTSLNATVIPPPVSGWRMFHESPRRITPFLDNALPCWTDGKNEFGIRRIRSLEKASRTDSCNEVGSWGRIFVRM